MLRRLHPEQPESFAFTPENLKWAEAQMAKYPPGRQASAVIPILWRAQEQEGWISRPAIEEVARMLDMATIRVLEVASFYFMFHLHPVGSIAHVQVCGTTSCMICGAEDLIDLCKERIAKRPLELSGDGRFSWEEVECLGACANAPMAQIGKDYYEDLDRESFGRILDALDRGEVPEPGSAKGRFASEPRGGLTSLEEFAGGHEVNASVALARAQGDTIARITGSPAPVPPDPPPAAGDAGMGGGQVIPEPGRAPPEDALVAAAKGIQPSGLDAPRGGEPKDLRELRGVGPRVEAALNAIGVFHLDQIAAWTDEEIAWVDENLEGFKGRVTRDNWVDQARRLLGRE